MRMDSCTGLLWCYTKDADKYAIHYHVAVVSTDQAGEARQANTVSSRGAAKYIHHSAGMSRQDAGARIGVDIKEPGADSGTMLGQ